MLDLVRAHIGSVRAFPLRTVQLLLLTRTLKALRLLMSGVSIALDLVPLRRALASRPVRLGDQRIVYLQYVAALR